MPASSAVEELVSAWTQKRYDVLEIGSGARGRSDSRGIQQSAPGRQQREAGHAAADFEAPRVDVLVRETIAGEVEDRAQNDCGKPRSSDRAGSRASGDMERNNHAGLVLAAARLPPGLWALTRLAPHAVRAHAVQGVAPPMSVAAAVLALTLTVAIVLGLGARRTTTRDA